MGRTAYLIAWLALALSGYSAVRPASAQNTASPVHGKVAAAVARDLPFVGADAGDQLEILAPPAMSLPARAELHVVSVRRGFSPGSWLVRMDCAPRVDCLPFHVVLRSTAAEPGNGAPTDRLSKAVKSASPNSPAQMKRAHAPLARSGDRMLLVEQRPGMRLQAKVVCLESGALGDAIRVRNLATHRVLLATIAGKDEVRVE